MRSKHSCRVKRKMDDITKNKLLGFLGIARKARAVVCGTEGVTQAVREGKCELVLCAGDISQNTHKRLQNTCSYYEVPCIFTEISMDEFSRAVGKMSAVSAIAVTDPGFARKTETYFSASDH